MRLTADCCSGARRGAPGCSAGHQWPLRNPRLLLHGCTPLVALHLAVLQQLFRSAWLFAGCGRASPRGCATTTS
eukprot:15445970-Alexandrium_andersonii.AAC.1